MTLTTYQSALDHYVRLEGLPGWRAYARARVKELEADPSGMWFGIENGLRIIILEREAKEASAKKLTDEMNRNKEEK